MAEVYGVTTASPPESHAQDKSSFYYVEMGVIFLFISYKDVMQR